MTSTGLDSHLDGGLLPPGMSRGTSLRPAGQALPLPEGLQHPGDDERPAILGQGRHRPERRLRAGASHVRPGLHPAEDLSAESVEDRGPGRGQEQPRPARGWRARDGPDDPRRLRLQPRRPRPSGPIQLEIFNVGNQIVVLDIGMPICQLILEEVREVPTRGYQGRFSVQRGFSIGPSAPSRQGPRRAPLLPHAKWELDTDDARPYPVLHPKPAGRASR